MHTQNTYHKILTLLLASLLPILFTFFWLSSNTQLPTADATDYLVTGHTIYHHFTDHGLWYGLAHFDIARGWRPIFFSVLTVPFLFISKGNVNFAFHALAITCVLASAIYVYLLSRLLLNRASSLIAANLICLLPLVQLPVLIFFAECALFPAVLGSIYHLIQSDYLRRKPHMWGFILCFSLAIVVRPIEAITELFFILLLFLASGWYKQIFSPRQLISLMALGLAAIFLLLFNTDLHFIHHYPFHPIDGDKYDIKLAQSIYITSWGAMIVLLFTLAGLAFMNKSANLKSLNQPPLLFTFAVIFVLVLMWFLPHAFQTYVWIYRTSFGDLALITANMRSKPSAWKVLSDFSLQESLLIVIGVALLALSSIWILGSKKFKEICLSSPVIYLLLLIPFPLWEVLNTIQNAPRKLNLAFPALILVLLMLGLQSGRGWKLRASVAAGLLMLQFLFAMNFLFPTINIKHEYANLIFGGYYEPYRLKPNPHDEVVKFLTPLATSHQIKSIALIVNPETVLPVDPYLLTMLSKIDSLPYYMGLPFYSSYSDKNIQSVHAEHDAVFLADESNAMVVSEAAANAYDEKFQKESNPTLKLQYKLLYFYARNLLETVGFRSDSCMVVNAQDGNEYRGCLLVVTSR